MNRDFNDMLSALSEEGVEHLVVGGYAMWAHGYVRATGDIDIWVRPTPENAERVMRALGRFGAPIGDVSARDFTRPDLIFQIGVPPLRVDLLTGIEAVGFEEAWASRVSTSVDGIVVNVLGREHLLRNKRAAGRPKDLLDAQWMEEEPGEG